MKRLFGPVAAIPTVATFCLLLLSAGCSVTDGEGFAIYLTKADTPPEQMPASSLIEMADRPIISVSDIVSYEVNTHEIVLTSDAFARVSRLEVPVRGTSFIVCVDKKPIYRGAFWTPISSISYNGVTNMKPLGSQDPHIKLELGYPGSSFYQGRDPRINAEVIQSLKKAGKLTGELPPTAVNRLPHSMKGYELYSWLRDGQWHFTLITGTNRNKTQDEIVSEVNTATEDGWVNIRMSGADEIRSTLSRLPQNEEVFWWSGLRAGQTPGSPVNISLPPAQIVEDIRERATQCGLHFTVQQP